MGGSSATGIEACRSWAAALDAAGLRDVGDVLVKAECIRDLPDRANHRLDVAGALVHVKQRKRPTRHRPQAECAGLRQAASLGIPVPAIVFTARDAEHGDFVGTADLSPARPLDDLLREGALDGPARRRTLRSLSRAIARLHRGRRHHRDLYLNHVYVDPTASDPVIAIIDWDRSGPHRRLQGRWVVKDLASLLASVPDGTVSEGELLSFAVRYLCLLDVKDRRRVLASLVRRVRKKASRIRAHVPRTPVGEAARPGRSAS